MNVWLLNNITDIEIEGIDMRDYPDFCDAYISYAVWEDTGEELTDEELDKLNEEHSDLVNELAHENWR